MECGRQQSKVKHFCYIAVSALRRFLVTDGQNTHDQVTRGRRLKHAWSTSVLCIPFIFSGSRNECWSHSCNPCVINNLGPVARSLVSANRWLRGIKMYRFPWYLTLVSANHASSNPGLVNANRWLRGIKMYRFPWYLMLVSANHASSNPGLEIRIEGSSCCPQLLLLLLLS